LRVVRSTVPVDNGRLPLALAAFLPRDPGEAPGFVSFVSARFGAPTTLAAGQEMHD